MTQTERICGRLCDLQSAGKCFSPLYEFPLLSPSEGPYALALLPWYLFGNRIIPYRYGLVKRHPADPRAAVPFEEGAFRCARLGAEPDAAVGNGLPWNTTANLEWNEWSRGGGDSLDSLFVVVSMGRLRLAEISAPRVWGRRHTWVRNPEIETPEGLRVFV